MTMPNIFQPWSGGFSMGGSGGSSMNNTTTTGGFTPTQLQLMDDLYGLYNNLPDEYRAYGGKRYEDFTDREKELLAKLGKGGGYDTIAEGTANDLGFAKGAFQDVTNYDTQNLTEDAQKLMNPYQASVLDSTRGMMAGLSAGMVNQNNANASMANTGGDRVGLVNVANNLGLAQQMGQVASNVNMRGYSDAMSNARALQGQKMQGAQSYANIAERQGNIRSRGLDKYYNTSLSAEGSKRDMLNKGLTENYKDWVKSQQYNTNKLKLGGALLSGMPIMPETVTSTQQPERSGK